MAKSNHNGRNKIYYYDLYTNEYGSELTLSDFNKKFKVYTRHLNILIIGKRYVIARTKEDLEKKLQKIKERAYKNNSNINNHRNDKKEKRIIAHSMKRIQNNITDEMAVDLKNNISWEAFCEKYNVCRKTYFNYRKVVFGEIGKDTKRVYKRRVNLDLYKKYRQNHTRKECAKRFGITIDHTYECDKKVGFVEQKRKKATPKLKEEISTQLTVDNN